MNSQERIDGGGTENLNVLGKDVDKHSEALRNKMERERKRHDKIGESDNIKIEVERAFEQGHDSQGNKIRQPKQSMPALKIIKKATKVQKKDEYKKTMGSIQKEMTLTGRIFSKFIHNPVIEKTSDAVGATVARPAALLAGSLSALILTAIIYIVAKYYGYPLSGAESIAAFVIGWLVGLIVDSLRVMILGKRTGSA